MVQVWTSKLANYFFVGLIFLKNEAKTQKRKFSTHLFDPINAYMRAPGMRRTILSKHLNLIRTYGFC